MGIDPQATETQVYKKCNTPPPFFFFKVLTFISVLNPILLSGIKYEISHLCVNSVFPGLNSVRWEFLFLHPSS